MNDKMQSVWDKIRFGVYVAGDLAVQTAETAGKKATEVYNASKINLKIFDLKADIDILYKKIGKSVYSKYKDENAEADAVDEILALIDQRKSQIEELEKQLGEARKTKKCEVCGKVSKKDVPFCAACGARLDD